MRSYYVLGLAVVALTVPQALGAQPQDRSGLSIFPQSPAPEQLAPSSPAPSLVFDQSYEYVGEVEYFDDPVSIDRR
ncbi:MAG: hypothetical protein HC919_13455, partial [Oscillatoriales cyanobacterium SM2_2_1]|nr:hypothetical protein [Oscillatoriales cyanobacterium SM2_2_1]